MIIHLPVNMAQQQVEDLARQAEAICLKKADKYVLITSSKVKSLPDALKGYASEHFVLDTDMQLSSRQYDASVGRIDIADTYIGGDQRNTLMIAGPCSIESEEQIEQSCQMLLSLGIKVLRAGCYKPRTSPYTFRGLGLEGLKLLAKMRDKYGLKICTEVRDSTHVAEVIEYADIVQIGAKSMYDHSLLTACGKARKPVILKRGFGTTLQEFANCADFIMSCGNEQVILCERGIRTFETKTRFTLDLCGVAWLKHYTNRPVILDPSHAMGYDYGVPDLARACMAMGVDGLLIETHPTPCVAKSDAAQQLDHDAFRQMYASLKPVAAAVGRQLV
ncbi:MAG: bifunctional 3-deoxy-7-phosphoheptulonate synthase/chorismate mutase [Paludibacteraceae bacterium]|nr:bifunctional 3-deoxy-7-phosphoheptulonate synthase/chorismate mutase [Paludibacteraceae bacterium]